MDRRQLAPPSCLSPQAYNARVGSAIVCPITALVSGYPFEVTIPPDLPVSGVILADQAMSLDWRAHRAERICFLPSGVVGKRWRSFALSWDRRG